MKKIVKNLMYLGLFSMALIFNSCQEEFEEVNGGSDQETITASSTTASLIKNTSTNDGSYDNIVDGASCFAINFPYTVEVSGVQITIDSREDLHLIEEIFDEFDDDEDILELIFPIVITLGDFTCSNFAGALSFFTFKKFGSKSVLICTSLSALFVACCAKALVENIHKTLKIILLNNY